jgi:hypothetical protein
MLQQFQEVINALKAWPIGYVHKPHFVEGDDPSEIPSENCFRSACPLIPKYRRYHRPIVYLITFWSYPLMSSDSIALRTTWNKGEGP